MNDQINNRNESIAQAAIRIAGNGMVHYSEMWDEAAAFVSMNSRDARYGNAVMNVMDEICAAIESIYEAA